MQTNGNGFWKYIAISALSVLLGMGVQIFRTPSDVVTSKDLKSVLDEQRNANLVLQEKLDSQSREISALRSSVNQQSVDIAGIAAKVGVTAHPVIAPR